MHVPGLEILKGKSFNVVLGSNLLQAVEGVQSFMTGEPDDEWGVEGELEVADTQMGESITAKLSRDGVLTIDIEGY